MTRKSIVSALLCASLVFATPAVSQAVPDGSFVPNVVISNGGTAANIGPAWLTQPFINALFTNYMAKTAGRLSGGVLKSTSGGVLTNATGGVDYEPVFRYFSMPTPSVSNVGQIVLFVGVTGAYENGSMYRCDFLNPGYGWTLVGAGSEIADAVSNHNASVLAHLEAFESFGATGTVSVARRIQVDANSWITVSNGTGVLYRVEAASNIVVISTSGAGYNGPAVGVKWVDMGRPYPFSPPRLASNAAWYINAEYYAPDVMGLRVADVETLVIQFTEQPDYDTTFPRTLTPSGDDAIGSLVVDLQLSETNVYTLATMADVLAALAPVETKANNALAGLTAKVDKATTINGHNLSNNVDLVSSDVSAVPTGKYVTLNDGQNPTYRMITDTLPPNRADYVYWQGTTNNNEITIYNCAGVGQGGEWASIVVPEWLYGYPVKAIAEDVFGGDSSVTSFVARTVTTLDGYDFSMNTALRTVDLPLVTVLKTGTFLSCGQLRNVNVPSVKTILTGAFSACNNLATLWLNSVTNVADNAFESMSGLKAIYWSGNSPNTVGVDIFDSTPNVTNYVLTSATGWGATFPPTGDNQRPVVVVDDFGLVTNNIFAKDIKFAGDIDGNGIGLTNVNAKLLDGYTIEEVMSVGSTYFFTTNFVSYGAVSGREASLVVPGVSGYLTYTGPVTNGQYLNSYLIPANQMPALINKNTKTTFTFFGGHSGTPSQNPTLMADFYVLNSTNGAVVTEFESQPVEIPRGEAEFKLEIVFTSDVVKDGYAFLLRTKIVDKDGYNGNFTSYFGKPYYPGFTLPKTIGVYAPQYVIDAHTVRTDNPHSVTAAQVGALTSAWAATGTVSRARAAQMLAGSSGLTWTAIEGDHLYLYQVANSTSVYVVSTSGEGYNGPAAGTVFNLQGDISSGGSVQFTAWTNTPSTFPRMVDNVTDSVWYYQYEDGSPQFAASDVEGLPCTQNAVGDGPIGFLILDWLPITNRYEVAKQEPTVLLISGSISGHNADTNTTAHAALFASKQNSADVPAAGVSVLGSVTNLLINGSTYVYEITPPSRYLINIPSTTKRYVYFATVYSTNAPFYSSGVSLGGAAWTRTGTNYLSFVPSGTGTTWKVLARGI